MSQKKVKLYIYQDEGETVYVDSIETESFDDFVLIKIGDDAEIDDVERLHDVFSKIFQNKKIVIIPSAMNLSFYGVRIEEKENDRPTDSKLQHETTSTETPGHTP